MVPFNNQNFAAQWLGYNDNSYRNHSRLRALNTANIHETMKKVLKESRQFRFRKDMPLVVAFADLTDLYATELKDLDDLQALLLLIGQHGSTVNLRHVGCNYFLDRSGAEFANLLAMFGDVRATVHIGSFVNKETAVYEGDDKKILRLKDPFIQESWEQGKQQIYRDMVYQAMNGGRNIIICTTALNETYELLRYIVEVETNGPKTVLESLEIYVQNNATISDDRKHICWDLGPTAGANTKFNVSSREAAINFANLINELADSDTPVPLLVTTRQLAYALPIPMEMDIYGPLKDYNIVSKVMWERKNENALNWWKYGNHDDGVEVAPAALKRSVLRKILMPTLADEIFQTLTRDSDILQYIETESPIYDPTVVMAALIPGIFDPVVDDRGNFMILGCGDNTGVIDANTTLKIFSHMLEEGLLKMPVHLPSMKMEQQLVHN